MVVRAVHRPPIRDGVSCGDGPQAACLATQIKVELRRPIVTHSTFSNAFGCDTCARSIMYQERASLQQTPCRALIEDAL